jgi:hypothetical protein
MSDIIEVLTLPLAASPTFTVNNAVDHVVLDPWSCGAAPFQNVLGYNFFEHGDNVEIISAGLTLPFSFTLAAATAAFAEIPAFFFQAKNRSGTGFQLNQIGWKGTFALPMENYEVALNSFIGNAKTFLEDWQLMGTVLDNTQVSMVNVPSILNTQTLPAILFVKVLHTKEMKS